jgi:hypothetical protein
MMHGSTLYAWTDNGEHELENISTNASNLYYLSDDIFFFSKAVPLTISGKTI